MAAALALTDKGRLVAITRGLLDRWDGLTAERQAEARALLDRLAETYRAEPPTRQPVRVRLIGRLSA
jgi:hypothetical protein